MAVLRNEEGVAAVEFAIIASLFFVLLFGIVEFSLALYDKAVITNASREGARKAILFNADLANPGQILPFSQSDISDHVNAYIPDRLVPFGGPPVVTVEADPTVNYVDLDGDGQLSRGDTRIVRVLYTYNFLVLPNFLTSLTGGLNLDAETRMRME